MLYIRNSTKSSISNSKYFLSSDYSFSPYTQHNIRIAVQIIFDKTPKYADNTFTDKEIAQLKAICSQSSDQELINSLADIQFLASSWLDECEKKIFNGLTLTEVLHEKGKI